MTPFPSSPPKQPPKHPSSKTPRDPTRIHRTRSQIRRLAEPIAPRESKRIRDCQDQRDSCKCQRRAAPPLAIHSGTANRSRSRRKRLTVQTQPDGTFQPHEREDGQADPQTGLRVQCQPEEPKALTTHAGTYALARLFSHCLNSLSCFLSH